MKNISKLIVGFVFFVSILAGCARPSPAGSVVPTPGTAVSPLDSPIQVPELIFEMPGKIAFHSNRTGVYQIFTMDHMGGSVVQVTDFDAPCSEPTWSPDGSRIAFTSNMDDASAFAIYTITTEGTDLKMVAGDGVSDNWYPSWSPDGESIAYQSNRDGNLEIYKVDVESGTEVRLTQNDYTDSMPRWSPDGSRLAYVSSPSGEGDIHVMNADGSNVRRLTESPGQNSQPAWSPDGRQIVFVSGRDGNGEIYVMDSDGNSEQRLTETDMHAEHTPFWVADGTQIMFSAPYDNDWEIYVMYPDGTNLRRVTYVQGDDRHAVWLPQD